MKWMMRKMTIKIILFKLLLLILPSISSYNCLADTNDERIVNFGIMKYFFSDVNINDAKVAMEGWTSELVKEYRQKTGVKLSPFIYYFDDINEMLGMLKSKKLDVVVLSSYDYLLNDLNKLVEPSMIDNPDDRLIKVMLVNKKSNYMNLNDIKSTKLSIEPGIEGIYSDYWLNMIYKKNGINDYKSFFSTIDTCKKSSMVITQLFFGKTDVCITSLFNFKTNSEMNPQIKEKIKILLSSEKTPYSIVGIRKDCIVIDGKILTEIAVNNIKNTSIKSMMELFKKVAVVPFRIEMMLPISELIKYNSNKSEKPNVINKIIKNKKK
jgi:ABC-type phosphate/phosphonate transport system substrate-binding protein